MKLAAALYLVTLTTSLAVPVAHERCDDVCNANRAAATAAITSNYRDSHTRAHGVTRSEQIKRDRERLSLLFQEHAAIERAIQRAMKGTL